MTPEVQNGYIPEHEFIRDPADCARVRCFREGCDANDHNHRVYRNQKGAGAASGRPDQAATRPAESAEARKMDRVCLNRASQGGGERRVAMATNKRAKIAAQVFSPTRAIRNLADEPLTADDWRKVWEARKSFIAAIRQIVFDARCRAEGERA